MPDQQKTILLVEDDVLIAMTEQLSLEEYGYKVTIAHSGEEAVKVFRNNLEIDLILMDIDLGSGIDGTQAAQEILKTKDIPVVFLSSHTAKEVVEKTEKITSYGYVVKNSGITVLDASIKMAFKLFEAKLKEREKSEALIRSEIESLHTKMIWERTINAISDIVCVISVNHEFIAINEAGIKSLGIPKEEIIGQKCYEIVHGTTSPISQCPCDRTLQSGKEESNEYEQDGRHYLLEAWPMYDELGRITSFVHIIIDITERKRAEEALKINDLKLRTIVDNVGDPIFVKDNEHRLVFVNRAFCEIFGLEESNIIGKTIAENVPEKERSHFLSVDRHVLDTGMPDVREETLTVNNFTRTIITRKTRYVDHSGKNFLFGSIHDITGRKKMEELLRENEEKFRTLFEQAGDYVLIIDPFSEPSLRIMDVNDAACREHGYTREEMLALTIWDIVQMLEPEKNREIVERLSQGEHVVFETMHRRKDGTLFPVEVNTSLGMISGMPRFVISIERNITDRKLADDKIKSLLAEKELILKEVHHRIKNNLGVVMGLLKLHANRQRDEAAKEAFLESSSQVNAMAVLYSKLYQKENHQSLSLRDYLPPLVDEIIGLLDIRKSVKTDILIQDIILAPNQLSPLGIIINELLSNTVKYAFPDGEGGVITIAADRKEDKVTLIFQDDGIGLPESAGLDKSRGFGLQLVTMLVAQINGTMAIERGKGTKFVIEFPAE